MRFHQRFSPAVLLLKDTEEPCSLWSSYKWPTGCPCYLRMWHHMTRKNCAPQKYEFKPMDRRVTLRAWSSPKWLTGCPCYPRMCHLAVCQQMRPSRQYWLRPQIQIRDPQIQIRGMLGFAVTPPGICRFLNFRQRFNQKFCSSFT